MDAEKVMDASSHLWQMQMAVEQTMTLSSEIDMCVSSILMTVLEWSEKDSPALSKSKSIGRKKKKIEYK